MPATKPSRLGRGLGNLISGGVSTEEIAKPVQKDQENGSEFQTLPLAHIQPNRFQPRNNFDDAQIDELVASIVSEGLLQPISVRKATDGKFEIIAGERRFRACKKLNKETIPVRILEVDDIASAALALIENLQRTDLNPVEEARGYQTLMKEFGLTQEKVAQRVGRSRAYIANALRLLQLEESLQHFLITGELSVGHAKVLLGLPAENDRKDLAEKIVSERLSVREAENEVRQIKGEDLAQAAKNASSPRTTTANRPPPPEVEHFQNSLGQKLSTSVSLKHTHSNRGSIVIDYRNMYELQRIMETLGVPAIG
jgi:ParB family chromosome partitioning protein